MTRRKSRMPLGPDVPCRFVGTDKKGRAKKCPERGTTARVIDGVWLLFCLTHAIAKDKEAETAEREKAQQPASGPTTCSKAGTDEFRKPWRCGEPATAMRVVEGVALPFCGTHASEIDADARLRARWDAEQAKLPAHKRRTLEQASDDEERAMGRKLRGSRKWGGP